MLDERIDCIRIEPDPRRAVPLLAAFTPRRIHPIWQSNQASPPVKAEYHFNRGLYRMRTREPPP